MFTEVVDTVMPTQEPRLAAYSSAPVMAWPFLLFTTVCTWGRSISCTTVVPPLLDKLLYRAAPPAPAPPPTRAHTSTRARIFRQPPGFLGLCSGPTGPPEVGMGS